MTFTRYILKSNIVLSTPLDFEEAASYLFFFLSELIFAVSVFLSENGISTWRITALGVNLDITVLEICMKFHKCEKLFLIGF